jgi:hypothetical protein
VRQGENFGEFFAVAVNIAAGFPNREFIAIPRGEAVAGLQGKRAGGLRAVGLLDDYFGFPHAAIDVAAEKFNRYFAREICPTANGRRVGFESALRIQYKGQGTILNLNQP